MRTVHCNRTKLSCAFFSKNYSKFRAKFVLLLLLCRPLCVHHATTLMVWKLPAQPMHPAVIAQANHTEYREIGRYFGDKDPTSRVPMETILAKEEEHADELSYLLFAVDPATGHKPQDLYFGDEVPDNF